MASRLPAVTEWGSAQTTQAGFNSQFHNALGRYFTFDIGYKFM